MKKIFVLSIFLCTCNKMQRLEAQDSLHRPDSGKVNFDDVKESMKNLTKEVNTTKKIVRAKVFPKPEIKVIHDTIYICLDTTVYGLSYNDSLNIARSFVFPDEKKEKQRTRIGKILHRILPGKIRKEDEE